MKEIIKDLFPQTRKVVPALTASSREEAELWGAWFGMIQPFKPVFVNFYDDTTGENGTIKAVFNTSSVDVTDVSRKGYTYVYVADISTPEYETFRASVFDKKKEKIIEKFYDWVTKEAIKRLYPNTDASNEYDGFYVPCDLQVPSFEFPAPPKGVNSGKVVTPASIDGLLWPANSPFSPYNPDTKGVSISNNLVRIVTGFSKRRYKLTETFDFVASDSVYRTRDVKIEDEPERLYAGNVYFPIIKNIMNWGNERVVGKYYLDYYKGYRSLDYPNHNLWYGVESLSYRNGVGAYDEDFFNGADIRPIKPIEGSDTVFERFENYENPVVSPPERVEIGETYIVTIYGITIDLDEYWPAKQVFKGLPFSSAHIALSIFLPLIASGLSASLDVPCLRLNGKHNTAVNKV